MHIYWYANFFLVQFRLASFMQLAQLFKFPRKVDKKKLDRIRFLFWLLEAQQKLDRKVNIYSQNRKLSKPNVFTNRNIHRLLHLVHFEMCLFFHHICTMNECLYAYVRKRLYHSLHKYKQCYLFSFKLSSFQFIRNTSLIVFLFLCLLFFWLLVWEKFDFHSFSYSSTSSTSSATSL